jgi:hypothetical protein
MGKSMEKSNKNSKTKYTPAYAGGYFASIYIFIIAAVV